MQVHYQKKRGLIRDLLLVELAQGMWLTLKRMFSKPITLRYPHEKPRIKRGFRGEHALVRSPKTGTTVCIGCMRCVKVCPSQCVTVRSGKDPETGKRVITEYRVNSLRCVYCGYCAEVCPVNAVILTEVFEYAASCRETLDYDKNMLLDNWDEYLKTLPGETLETYVNPLWRPRGLPDSAFAPGKRLPVDEEWRGEKQVVGKTYRETQEQPRQQEN